MPGVLILFLKRTAYFTPVPESSHDSPPGGKVKRPGERHSLSRSATRALDVLELFGEMRHPLRAIEMCKALGVHPSSMNQLLKTMVESAHLTFDAQHKTYLPSPRLARFSAWMLASYDSARQFHDLLHSIHQETGEIATLTTPNDLFMQILDVVGTPFRDEAARRGLRVSLFGSTTGAAYLSILPKAEILRLASRARITDPELQVVLKQIANFRRSGAADGPSLHGGFWSLAMPLPAELSPSPLILGLAGPVHRIRPNLALLQTMMRRLLDHWVSGRDANSNSVELQ